MENTKKSFEIGIKLNRNGDIIGTVTDSTQTDVDMILDLPENEYNEVVYGKTHSNVIFAELGERYRMEIEFFLNDKLDETA